MATQNYLAFDLGAESGRGVLATFDGDTLDLQEVGRFPTTRGEADLGPDGVRRWDLERIWGEIARILQAAEAQQEGGLLHGVGVDTWGVDFGLLDAQGQLLEAPVAYRDDSHARAMADLLGRFSKEEIWDATGIQFMPFNTIYQLLAIQKRDPSLLGRAQRLLFLPDLLTHRLSQGVANVNEVTIASTSQLLDPTTKQWNTDLMAKVGIPADLFAPIVAPGTHVGTTAAGTPVYTTGSHDTASAVAAVPAQLDRQWAFLSSGTWSLLGAERHEPALSHQAMRLGLSNETGIAQTTRLLKNIMGLWLVQECRRSLLRAGQEYDYATLTALAAAAPANGPLIDATDQRFLAPADMPQEIRAACLETGQTAPQDIGSLIRCCLESLALAYRRTLRDLETLLGTKFEALHIVGGGTKNTLLNQWAADACGIPVIAGPSEATGAGDVLAQMIGAGVLKDWNEARQLSRRSFTPETYLPAAEASARWQERDSITGE